MLTNLRKQIKGFANYAEECAREAETAPTAVRDHLPEIGKALVDPGTTLSPHIGGSRKVLLVGEPSNGERSGIFCA
jgi:hypothetical protein